MAAKFVCDGCGKEEPATYGAGGRTFKPADWYERADDDGPQHACSRECIGTVSTRSGKTALVAPF